jgi:hypothetical protein
MTVVSVYLIQRKLRAVPSPLPPPNPFTVFDTFSIDPLVNRSQAVNRASYSCERVTRWWGEILVPNCPTAALSDYAFSDFRVAFN